MSGKQSYKYLFIKKALSECYGIYSANEVDYRFFNLATETLTRYRQLRIINGEIFYAILIKIDKNLNEHIQKKAKCRLHIRQKASLFIGKKSIRKKVFRKHGKTCLCCGANKDISLDHIVPVNRGGKNEISNLQPLCRKCNSSKGTKIIDYRK